MGRTSRKRHRKKKHLKNIKQNGKDSVMHLKLLLTRDCSVVNNLESFNFPITGRGLKTLKDIKANDILMEIPYEVLITTSTLSQSKVSNIFSQLENYSAQCLLSAFIVYESHLGNTSKWYHYINSLPQDLTNPDFCTQKEKNLLPSIIIDYMYECHKVQNDYKILMRYVNGSNLNARNVCSHCNIDFNRIITFYKYKWAYYIINSRAVYIDPAHIDTEQKNVTINIKHPNNLALAPFLDLFNHDIDSSTYTAVVTKENGNKVYQITTLTSFHSGSQVLINYGAHNSLKLYVHYGFFIPNNPLDEVHFDISDIQVCFDVKTIKLNFIITNHLHKNMAFTRDGLNYNALRTLFIMSTNLHKNHWSLKIYGNSLTSDDITSTNTVAKKILNLKKNKLIWDLTHMKSIKHYTQCYSIAINLIEEYIEILNQAYTMLLPRK